MGVAPPIQLASLGMADSLILMVLALVVFGPRRLPKIGRQIGKLMYEFRKASNDFKFQMEEELRISEENDRRKKEEEERQRDLALAASTEPPAQPLEAKAAIGADDQASVSAPPPAESESRNPETAPVASEQRAPYPRISPPATGEQVQRQGSGISHPNEQEPLVEDLGRDRGSDSADDGAVEANIGTEAASNGTGSPSAHSAAAPSDSPTETVTHHG